MVETPSTMLPLGTIAPDFTLPDVVSGNTIHFRECQRDRGSLIMFICNHCPYVLHIADKLFAMANDYQQQGFTVIAINANDIVHYPDDAPDKMLDLAKQHDLQFPYCFDESQSVAKAYHAACTPDFFLFDKNDACVYRGQFDAARPGKPTPVTGSDIQAAVDALLQGNDINPEQIPSVGCNIKWKS